MRIKRKIYWQKTWAAKTTRYIFKGKLRGSETENKDRRDSQIYRHIDR